MSQTLSVPSSEPETILVPSWLNLTERMISLWAFGFSLWSSSVAAMGRANQLKEEMSGLGLNARLHPRL